MSSENNHGFFPSRLWQGYFIGTGTTQPSPRMPSSPFFTHDLTTRECSSSTGTTTPHSQLRQFNLRDLVFLSWTSRPLHQDRTSVRPLSHQECRQTRTQIVMCISAVTLTAWHRRSTRIGEDLDLPRAFRQIGTANIHPTNVGLAWSNTDRRRCISYKHELPTSILVLPPSDE